MNFIKTTVMGGIVLAIRLLCFIAGMIARSAPVRKLYRVIYLPGGPWSGTVAYFSAHRITRLGCCGSQLQARSPEEVAAWFK